MQPQYIWFWSFEGFPIFTITAGIAIVGWFIQATQGRISWGIYREGSVIAMVLLWAVFQLSEMFAPFDDDYAVVKGSLVISTFTTILVMFLVVIGLLSQPHVLRYFAIAMIIAGAYYSWWANWAYVTSDWTKFEQGRLLGPARSPYFDGNVLSVLFVTTMPFILFGIFRFRSLLVRCSLIFVLPLLWHAIILCASRGALLSMCVSTLLAAAIIKSRTLNLVLVSGLVVFLVWQGAPIIERAVETVNQSDRGQSEPINPRIISWQVGLSLLKQYPFLGVGPQRFRNASIELFPNVTPYVAHSTPLNFAANTGILAGAIYLFFFVNAYRLYRVGSRLAPSGSDYEYINRSCACALAGFFVGALFLDLIIFEPFYFVLLLTCANHYLLTRQDCAPSPTCLHLNENRKATNGRI
jgi:O-antigen ligase